MKQSLQLRLSQSLALTPQLQLSIRLLQLSTLELDQEIETILLENPLLELEDAHQEDQAGTSNKENESLATDFQTNSNDSLPSEASNTEVNIDSEDMSFGEFDDNFGDYSSSGQWDENNQNDDEDQLDFKPQEASSLSLKEHILLQIKLMPLSARDFMLVSLLLDAINDDGYLEQDLVTLAEIIDATYEVDIVELETALKLIQSCDPEGVGARDLSECLLLQLLHMPADTPYLALCKTLIQKHLPLLAGKDFVKLRKLLGCDEASLKAAQQLLTTLNPKPGGQFSRLAHDHFIQHEVVVKKKKGLWIASINEEAMPKLRINQLYVNILKTNRENSSQYLASQMQEAKWMIKNIQQRFATILRVSQAIVDRQRNFFEHGEIAMRPLVLREIADELGLHESTISRVTTHKYMLTPRGIFELKYFFGSSVSTETGGSASSTAIRALIKQFISEENVKKPLSDHQLADILSKQGIVVARRTIAKYREGLQIPPASLRKTL